MAFLRTLRAAVRVCVLGGLPIFLLASAGAQAQGDAATVVVTATRTIQSIDDALSSVTIITRADIQARQATSVQELLTGEAGIQISNNGGLGKATALFLRGTDADQVLVLVDGVKLTSVTLGTTAFEYLPVEEIDRIEIVRGPRSSLYGSEAVTTNPARSGRALGSAFRGMRTASCDFIFGTVRSSAVQDRSRNKRPPQSTSWR